jgi:hypothetical protein
VPRSASGTRQDTVRQLRTLLASPLGRGRRQVVRADRDEGASDVTDVVYVLLTLVVFGLLALAVRGVEKL